MTARYEEEPSAQIKIEGACAEVVEAIAELTANDAMRYAPVLTGELRSKIDTHKVTALHWRVVANTDYAAAVERGHTTRSGNHVPAQPYLRPAAFKNRGGELR